MDERLKNQLLSEIGAINATLRAFKLNAGTKPAWAIVGGDQLVLYGMRAAAGQAISEIERRLPEISEAISNKRKAKTLVRLLRHPLRLEVTHPHRKPLLWNAEALTGAPDTMLLGRTYDGAARDLWHHFGDAPHVLVAGTTGAGKSVAMLNMLLPLCYNTSPDDLRILLIDMKNTDLVPLARLPHTDVLATTISRASAVLDDAVKKMLRRQAKRVAMPRLLIVIDEYADLTADADCMRLVGELVCKGRSASINLLVATQHPTGKAMGDSTIKNNFAARCVGLVADASAASCAAGRPGTHAELLPGKGAFLYVTGLDCIRYQSYLLDEVASESLITRIGRKWRSVVIPNASTKSSTDCSTKSNISLLPSGSSAVEARVEARVEAFVEQSVEPIRDEIDVIADTIREAWGQGASMNKLSNVAFGKNYGGNYKTKIDLAVKRLGETIAPVVDTKIIRLPRRAAGGD